MDEVYEQVEEARKDHIDLILEVVMDYIINRLAIENYDLSSEDCDWCMQLVEHGLRAAMCTSQGIHTATADIAQEMCERILTEENEEEPEE